MYVACRHRAVDGGFPSRRQSPGSRPLVFFGLPETCRATVGEILVRRPSIDMNRFWRLGIPLLICTLLMGCGGGSGSVGTTGAGTGAGTSGPSFGTTPTPTP